MKIDRYGRITMTRHQLCKLILACSALEILGDACAGSANQWSIMHDELQDCLLQFDEIRRGLKAKERINNKYGCGYVDTDMFSEGGEHHEA